MYLELEEEHLLWLKELKIKGCEIIHDKYKFNLGRINMGLFGKIFSGITGKPEEVNKK